MARLIIFVILAVVILASAVFCVTTKRIMRAATALLFVLFSVAGLYFILDYTFLGAAQISIYAGGITMMYIFAIQLVDKNTGSARRLSLLPPSLSWALQPLFSSCSRTLSSRRSFLRTHWQTS